MDERVMELPDPEPQPDPRPTVTVSRRGLVGAALALTVIAASVGGVASWAADGAFSDVPPTHVFYEEINWAANHGIVAGYGDGTFKPGVAVSRGAAAAYLSRYNETFRLEKVSLDPVSGEAWIGVATCDPGERALAGGGAISSPDISITDSNPLPAGDAWRVRWESDNDAVVDPSGIEVWALCAPATPSVG